MFAVNSFLGRYSLEKGSLIIGWSVLVLSVMVFYVNLFLILAAFFMTPETIKDYLKDTELHNLSKEGNKIEF
jgi:hypothetical protein